MRRIIFLSLCFWLAEVSEAEVVDHINVTGTEVVHIKPDMAVLAFNVMRESKTADEAKKQVDAIAARILDKLKKYDNKDLKIIANNLSINKNRNYQTGEIINYNVGMPFEIEIYNLAMQNRVLDDLLAIGVDDVSPLAYKLKDENVAYDRAMQAALLAAKNRAEKIAAFYSRALGPVQIIEDGNFANHSPMPMRAMMEVKLANAAADTGSQVMVPDHIDYSFTVYVTYTLK